MRYWFRLLCVCALCAMPLVGCGETACEGNVCPCNEAGIRAAIEAGGEDPYTFDCEGPTTVVTQAEIVIDNDVILDGEGNLTVDGDNRHRVFSVPEGVSAELRWLTVTRGSAALWASGGGVASEGTLTIRGCVISNNAAGSPSGATGDGGGILNAGQMIIIDTTITRNSVSHGTGGGIFNACSGRLTLVNSSISENQAAVDGWGVSVGGGIDNRGEMTIVNSTVSGNEALAFEAFGGGIASSGWMSLTNSTVSGNIADEASAIALHSYPGVCPDRDPYLETAGTLIDGDCGSYGEEGSKASWISNGYNIESPGDTCGFDQTGDLVNITEGQLDLGELAANGGPTMTHALGAGSVAIDQIPAVDCEVTEDQRGQPRPETDGTMCDVGSFEVQP